MGANTCEVTSDNFQDEVLGAEKPVLIDFWAEWCGPCKMIAPIVDELADEYDAVMKVGKLDADEYGDIMMQYGIMSVPTLLLFKDGEVAERLTGYKPKKAILDKFEPHFS